jgi:hypothetical protein
MTRFGQQKPVVVDGNGIVRAGNGTIEAARQLGWADIDMVRTELVGSEATAFALADNRTSDLSEFDDAILIETLRALQAEDFPIADIGFADFDFSVPPEPTGDPSQTLAERFGVPPFSVLDARQGYWQDRKRGWLAQGIQSELGRGGHLAEVPDRQPG